MPDEEKWWQNPGVVFLGGVVLMVCVGSICGAAIAVVKQLYPSGLGG